MDADDNHQEGDVMDMWRFAVRCGGIGLFALALGAAPAQAQLLTRTVQVTKNVTGVALRTLADISGTVTSPVGDILVSTAQLAGPYLAHTVIRVQGRYVTIARGTAAVDVGFSHDGQDRRFLIIRPSTAYENSPVVLMLHGNGGTAENQANVSEIADLVATEGFWAVLPDALNGTWNDNPAYSNGVDDVGFLADVVAILKTNFFVDAAHIAVSGLSNGAFMAERFACERSDLVSAAALISGTASTGLGQACSPAKPRPIMFMNGTTDPIVPYNGGRLGVMSSTETFALWQTLHNCDPSAVTTTALPDSANDGTTVDLLRNTGCGSGKEVRLYRVNGGGHAWPGGWQYLPIVIIGTTSADVNASSELWNFVRGYTND